MTRKNIGGHQYRGPIYHIHKRDADSYAVKHRKEGYLVRVVKVKDGYETWMALGTAKNKYWKSGRR